MYETMRDSIRRLLMLAVLSITVAGCGTGEGPKSTLAVCTTNSDLSFGSPKYLLSMNMAELNVSDSCAALESVSVSLSDGTETIILAVTLDAFGDATVDVNFGSTNAASNTIQVVLGDTLTATFTDSGGNPKQDTTLITDVLAAGVYSETNTLPSLPVADIITRRPGGKITTVDTRSQAVTLYDGFHVLEADYDTSAAGGDFNGIVFEFGPARLKNDSFELPDTSGGDVGCSQDWNCFNFSFTSSSEFDPGNSPIAHSGTQFLKEYGDDGGTQQSIAVQPGDRVSASAWALNWSNDEMQQFNLGLMQLGFFDADDNPLGGGGEVLADTEGNQAYLLTAVDGDSPDDWTLMEVSGTAPAGAVRANLLLMHIQPREFQPDGPFLSPGGSIFWDDARLTIEPGATGEDLSVFEFLRFAAETAAITGISDLTIVLEDASGASASVFLSAYSATASPHVTGWSTYEIPLADFTGLDMTAITSLGFFDASSSTGSPATLTDATLYFDDINFAIGAAAPPLAAPTSTGMLVNSPIEGVSYSTNTQSGVTNAAGEFEYIDGESVTFRIGGITLGTVAGRAVVSPVELTGSLDPTNQAAINMLVFLQSIDADRDSSNGIQVSAFTQTAAASASLNFNLSAGAFASAVTSVVNAITEPDNPIVSATDALDSFYATYVSLNGTQTFDWLFPGYDPVGEPGFELVWSDEFNSGTAPSDYWNRETGYGNNGWGNDEWQLYTTDPANLSVAGGVLNISARCDTAPDCNKRDGTITSARINTSGNFEFKYGKVSARIKAPTGNGAWSAFWMLGANFPTVGWPFSGEIDITEIAPLTIGTDITQFAIHWCDETNPNVTPGDCFPEGRVLVKDALNIGEDIGDDFHVFEAVWDENGITGLIDGTEYFFRAIDPGTMDEFLKEFFLILNVAVGGTLGGAPDATTSWPQTMLVDWVRVYQPTAGNGSSTINPPASTVSGITTTLEASAPTAIADGNPNVTITVQAKDSNGIDINTSAGTVTLDATGSASVGTVNDVGDGSYTATVSSTVAENVTISGTIAGQVISASVAIDFTPGPVSGAGTTIDVDFPTVESNGTDVSTITVQAADQFGNIIDADVGTVMLMKDSVNANLSAVSYVGGGMYTATVSNTVAEPVIISGTIAGNVITDTAQVNFSVGAVSGPRTTMVAVPDSNVVADGANSSTVTVQARDGTGNDITIDVGTVQLFASGSASVGTVSYAGNGQYTADVTSLVAETVTITGTIAGNSIGNDGNGAVTISFVPGAVSGANTTMSVSPASAVSNGLSQVTVTVQAFDANDNRITTDVGAVMLMGDGSQVISTETYAGDGSYTANVTNTVAETVNITGTIDGNTITANVDVSFDTGLGLFSDINSVEVLPYSEIIDQPTACKQIIVDPALPDASFAAREGGFSLQADFTSAGVGNNCNGMVFNFMTATAGSTLAAYSQDWEAKSIADPNAISEEGFVIGNVNVTTGGSWFAGQGAPNGGQAYSALVDDQGGAEQGSVQLSIYSDYAFPFQNCDNCELQTFVFKDVGLPTAADVGTVWRLGFDAKLGDIDLTRSDAWAYISVIKTSDGSFGEIINTRFDSDDELPTDFSWSGGNVDVTITSAMVGETLQFGFATQTAEYNDLVPGPGGEGIYPPTGVFYDNLDIDVAPRDISAYTRLSFAINTSAAATFTDLEIEISDADGSSASVNLVDYAPAVIDGDWEVYEVPLADFAAGVDLAAVTAVGFLNASSTPLSSSTTLVDETLYFDDIHLVK